MDFLISILWIIATPALLLSNESMRLIERFLPGSYSSILPHHEFVRFAVFFVVCLIWAAFLLAPWWLSFRLGRLSHAATQVVILVVAVAITFGCFSYAFSTFPSPD